MGSTGLASTHPQEADLLPGDVLFLPPLVSDAPMIFLKMADNSEAIQNNDETHD